jgi:hypothetical protein
VGWPWLMCSLVATGGGLRWLPPASVLTPVSYL